VIDIVSFHSELRISVMFEWKCNCAARTCIFEYDLQFLLDSYFLVAELDARWSPTTLGSSSLCILWQPFAWSVDWAWRTKRMLSNWFIFWGMCQREYLRTQCKFTWWNETTDSRYFAAVVTLLRKSIEPFSQVSELCATFWGFCWNLTLNGRVRWAVRLWTGSRLFPGGTTGSCFPSYPSCYVAIFRRLVIVGKVKCDGVTPKVSLWVTIYVSGTRLMFSRVLCQF